MTNADFSIAVLPGDGIGKEITDPSVQLAKEAAHRFDITLNFETLEAGVDYDAKRNGFKQSGFARLFQAL